MPFGRTFDLVIHGARADSAPLREAVEWLRTIGHRVRAHVTWESGDARRFAADAAHRGTDAVLAVGGDGTVNEVVNGLLGTDVALGIIPVGTANDFARQTGIPADARGALEVVLEHEAVRIDVGTLNGRAFLNVSSAGIGAETTAETSAAAKGLLGPLAYALTGVRKMAGDQEARRARFTGRASTGRSSSCISQSATHARPAAGRSSRRWHASTTGCSTCVWWSPPHAPPTRAAARGPPRRTPRARRRALRADAVVTVESEAPIVANLDGEPTSLTSLEYRVIPAALRVHVAWLPSEEPDPTTPP
jgi:diacylglycerol kinase family enzyme